MSTEFIGRERELADLRRRWELAAHGTPQLIICRGEPGIGKTRLATELAAWVRTRGGRTLWARALEARDAPPFGLWRQVFDSPDLGIEDPAAGRTRLFDGFAARLTGDEAVLVVVDDIHWADEPSLLALRHIVRSWREQRILLCANARDASADAAAGWRSVAPELLREPVTHVLELTGLSQGSSAACLSAAAERAVSKRITAAAYEMSGGNPFYLRELGRGLRGSAEDELRLPATLREVVRGRLATLPPRAQELLRAAAILDDAFPVAVAARLIGRPVLECLPALDAAVASGLLVIESHGGTVRFTHALVRAALQEGLPLQQRVLLHARAARAIEELYSDDLDHHAAALARHYAESALAGDRAPALRWASRAGDNALLDLAFEEAARLYTVALEHAAALAPADRGRLLLDRATAHFRAGNLEPARADCLAAGELARRTGDANLLAERALILEPVGNQLWDRDIHEWCTEAIKAEVEDHEVAGEGAATTDRAESLRARLLARATEAASYLGRWDEIGETSTEALALADRCGDIEALVAALRARQLACTGPEHLAEREGLAVRMIEIGVRTRRPATELWGRLWSIDNQWERGDLGAVEAELSRLRWCVRHTGGPMATWHVLLTEAALAQARGELDDALRVAEQARQLAESLGHPAGFGAYRSLLGNIGHHRGHAEVAFEIPPAEQRGEVRNRLFSVLGPASPLAESGRLDEAARLYRSLGSPPEWGIPPFFRLIVMTVGGSIAVALGLTADIAWFADQLAAYHDRHVVSGAGNAHYFGPVPLWLGKFAAALGDSATAERELRAAREICRDNGAQGFVVEASCELAEVLLGRGATEEALSLAKTALPVSESIGMPPWTDRLRRITAEASARAVLSPREREVAELVAAGKSNREIAAALVLSERTAQNHVQHILTKLGFTNRAQIGAWVNRAR